MMKLISDMGLEGINGEARKSGRPSPSRWNSMRLGIMLFIALSFAVVVSGDTMTIPENRFRVSNWNNVTFDDLYADIDQIQPRGGISSSKGLISVTSYGFFDGLFAALAMIAYAELYDMTFFFAAVLSMRHSRLVVFAGAITALGLMTVLSARFTIMRHELTYFLSTCISAFLFGIFGSKMFQDANQMSEDGQEVLGEPQATLEENNDIESQVPPLVNDGDSLPSCLRSRCIVFSLLFLQAFAMTFLTEGSDRSQITLLFLLASRHDVTGVCVGAILAHCFSTGLAVIGGRKLAKKISVLLATIIGGVVFYTLGLYSMTKGVEFTTMSELQWLRKDDL